jgi:hypothetical protein
MKVVWEHCTAHPGHWSLGESLRLWHSRVKLGLEVPTLDVEPAHVRPLDGDVGILSCTSAI